MDNFNIEKDVPYQGLGKPRLYPWDRLEVGDSVSFPGEEYAKARGSARNYQVSLRVNGRDTILFRGKFDLGTRTGRIWRVA